MSSKCRLIGRNSDRVLKVHFLLSGSSGIAIAEAVQPDMLEDKEWEKSTVCTSLKSPVLCVVPGQQAGILKARLHLLNCCWQLWLGESTQQLLSRLLVLCDMY